MSLIKRLRDADVMVLAKSQRGLTPLVSSERSSDSSGSCLQTSGLSALQARPAGLRNRNSHFQLLFFNYFLNELFILLEMWSARGGEEAEREAFHLLVHFPGERAGPV